MKRWPPRWLARFAARRLLRMHEAQRYSLGSPNPRCPCERCDLARRVLKLTS